MKLIELTQNKQAIVDDENFQFLNNFKWHASLSRGNYYALRSDYYSPNKAYHISMARTVMGVTDPHIKIDHKNGNTLDNRKENLRLASNQTNARNRTRIEKTNTSGYRGVSFYKKTGSWMAYIREDNGKQKNLGYFSTPKEAALAFDKAAKTIYGEFCGKLNFGDSND